MSEPQFLILAPLLFGAITLFLRRWQIAAAVFGLVSVIVLLIGLAVISIDSGSGFFGNENWLVFGRVLTITDSIRWTLLTGYSVLAVLIVLSFVFTQSTVFIPLGISLLSPLAGALMVRPFVFGAVMLLIAAAAVAVLIQGERAGSTLASWRHISIYALAPPLLLVAGWMLENDQSEVLRTVPALFSLVFIILLVGFPFQIWAAPASAESDSLVLAIALGLVQLLVVFFCIELLRNNPIILRNSQFSLFLRYSGMITILLAAILALTARSLGRFIGYLILIDTGATLYALASGVPGGLDLAFKLVFLRTVSLILVAIGLAMFKQATGIENNAGSQIANGRSVYRGIGRRYPLAVMVLVYGSLSIIGTPLTPGFSGKWALIDLGSQLSLPGTAIIVAAMAAAAIGLVRWVVCFWTFDETGEFTPLAKSRWSRALALLAMIGSIAIAIFPNVFGGLLSHITGP